jgi:hypothetical protein
MKVIAISGHFTPLEVERWGVLGATCVAKGSDFWAKFANALFEVSSTNILNEMCAFDARVRKRTAVLLALLWQIFTIDRGNWIPESDFQ